MTGPFDTHQHQLLEQLQTLLASATRRDDLQVLLSPQATELANAIAAEAPEDDLEVRETLGWWHWLRCQVLPEGQDQEDLLRAVSLLRSVYLVAPDRVPEPLRNHFSHVPPTDQSLGDAVAEPNLQPALTSTNPADLEDFIKALSLTVTTAPSDQPESVGYLSDLGIALATRFGRSGATVDLDRAVEVLGLAVTATPSDHPDRPTRLSNLGNALATRFARTGNTIDLDRAIEVHDESLTTVPRHHPHRPVILHNLGGSLQARYRRNGDRADLDRAIEVLDVALDTTPIDDVSRPAVLANLGNALRSRFECNGDTADLDRAIEVLGQAVDTTPNGHPDGPRLLTNLGTALRIRFDRSGDTADLDRAIDMLDASVSAAHTDHPELPGYLSNLGSALDTRFRRTGESTDLDRAIVALSRAVTRTPTEHPDRPMHLSNLAMALQSRSERTGPSDLDRAIDALNEAISLTPTDHADRPTMLSNLGNLLRARFESTGEAKDLDRAINVQNLAVTTTHAGHADRPRMLFNLANLLQVRYERTGQTRDLDLALHLFRHGALAVSASPARRARSARGWGRCAVALERWSDSVEGYEVALELLGQVVPGWLDRDDQTYLLAQMAGIGSEAAAACLQAGIPDRAVELFEQGRGVLFAQTLDTRTDLTDLADLHPDLASRFEDLSWRLSKPTTDTDSGMTEPDAGVPDTKDRRRAHDQMVELLEDIRGLDGFATFLVPRPAVDLLPDQGSGAVVLVNIADLRSDALILTSTGIQTVSLPDATPAAVAEQVNRLWASLGVLSNADPRPTHQERDDAESQVQSVLEWLWAAITEPVLTNLGYTVTPGEGQVWPRVWWCPSGPLAFSPLHAAGHQARCGSDSVLDRVVSSTIPTIRALQDAQERTGSPTADEDRVLVVAMPTTPDTDDPYEAALPGVTAETGSLKALLRDRVDVLGLPDTPAATHDTVTEALPGHRWVHFSCHARTDVNDPAKSALLLTDHQTRPLTVADLSALRLDRAELAVLSACSTALTGARLPDEPIHLSAACQLAGYRHVIATIWPLNDDIAAYATGIIYRSLATTTAGAAALDADQAAAATHHATRTLRHQLPDQPSLWAMLIHTGP